MRRYRQNHDDPVPMGKIQWSSLDFSPELLVTCNCWTVYRSHAMLLIDDSGHPHVYTRKPCPSCGGTMTAKVVAIVEPADDRRIGRWPPKETP